MYRVRLGMYFSKHTCWAQAWAARDRVWGRPAALRVLLSRRY